MVSFDRRAQLASLGHCKGIRAGEGHNVQPNQLLRDPYLPEGPKNQSCLTCMACREELKDKRIAAKAKKELARLEDDRVKERTSKTASASSQPQPQTQSNFGTAPDSPEPIRKRRPTKKREAGRVASAMPNQTPTASSSSRSHIDMTPAPAAPDAVRPVMKKRKTGLANSALPTQISIPLSTAIGLPNQVEESLRQQWIESRFSPGSPAYSPGSPVFHTLYPGSPTEFDPFGPAAIGRQSTPASLGSTAQQSRQTNQFGGADRGHQQASQPSEIRRYRPDEPMSFHNIPPPLMYQQPRAETRNAPPGAMSANDQRASRAPSTSSATSAYGRTTYSTPSLPPKPRVCTNCGEHFVSGGAFYRHFPGCPGR